MNPRSWATAALSLVLLVPSALLAQGVRLERTPQVQAQASTQEAAVNARQDSAAETAAPDLTQEAQGAQAQGGAIEVAPAARAAEAVDVTEIDRDQMIRRLRELNQRLRVEQERLSAEIDRLRAENARLVAELREMTSREGSAVRAYCESPNVSRNTAGGLDECGIYLCNQASGLCRDRCTISDHCVSGTACDVAEGRCAYPSTDEG